MFLYYKQSLVSQANLNWNVRSHTLWSPMDDHFFFFFFLHDIETAIQFMDNKSFKRRFKRVLSNLHPYNQFVEKR